MANTALAAVIALDSPRASAAAQRRARRRSEAMHRHPSSIARQRAAALGEETVSAVGYVHGYFEGAMATDGAARPGEAHGWYDFTAELPAESAEAVVLQWSRL